MSNILLVNAVNKYSYNILRNYVSSVSINMDDGSTITPTWYGVIQDDIPLLMVSFQISSSGTIDSISIGGNEYGLNSSMSVNVGKYFLILKFNCDEVDESL